MAAFDWKSYALSTAPFVLGVPIIIWIAAARHRRRHPPTPEQIEAAKALSDPRWLRSGWIALLLALVYDVVATVMRYSTVSWWTRVGLALVPCAVLAWLAVEYFRELRSEDELTRRVQSEAATIALAVFVTISMGMWVMDVLAGTEHHGLYNAAIGVLPMNYFLALFIMKGKYMQTPEAK